MSELSDLYQEVILDHSKHPRNFGRPAAAEREADGHNPLCGDRITVYLRLVDGRVVDVGFEGRGCAISVASASLMTELVKGRTEAEARALFRRFHHMLTDPAEPGPVEDDDLERLEPLAGVRQFPMRVKCATLPWHTLNAALSGKVAEVTTE